ncbi:hypothetical protein GIB67_020494 [Kingdonia uniflora]|uniref:MATH domain-containing protein n=1 Tax=Kingdonia uniflora TaxID=39325 RepID=A0A7J7PBW4_9MAGN|nr:hypothetical protein GIB67_020494 [Kingdonia uniflora]
MGEPTVDKKAHLVGKPTVDIKAHLVNKPTVDMKAHLVDTILTPVITRSVRDLPPTHYSFRIQSFSLLSKNSITRYESTDFKSGGYNWKLSLYPSGNTDANGKDHVSLYLMMSDTNSLPAGWEVNVIFRLFLFDQIQDKYLVLEDNNGGRFRLFHELKKGWGFSQFIPLATFNNPGSGYLVNDSCEFGAEVFVRTSAPKSESLSMVMNAKTVRHTWKTIVYPKGRDSGKYNSISLYIMAADMEIISPGGKLFIKYQLWLKNQINSRKDVLFNASTWTSFPKIYYGWQKFIDLKALHDDAKGFLLNDTCIVEAEITVLGIVNKLR